MIKWAGWIITLCGIGHTTGSLIQTAPDNAGRWFDGSLWGAGGDFGAWSEPVATFWYTLYSFGPPLPLLLVACGLLLAGARQAEREDDQAALHV